MRSALTEFVPWFLSLSWLTGPIFDKELRVSSRRRRNYSLRFIYLALLTVFLALMWLAVVRYDDSPLRQVSRMAEAGQRIIVVIVWFQFLAIQLVAVVMLSTSISDEIYNRTLGVLMTTPINSFQIVMGKLFSKLLQLLLLLGISLPLLAVVRVFGGVPWDYVLSSLCITLTTVIFVGSLSLFFSIFNRRAYSVIIITFLTVVVFFILLPYMAALAWHVLDLRQVIGERTIFALLFHPNPYGTMIWRTQSMFNPRTGMPALYWPLNCGIMLAASALVLSVAVVRVRKVALRQATGQLETSRRRRRNRKKAVAEVSLAEQASGQIRPIKGCPAIWKELRTPILRGRRLTTFIVPLIALVLVFVSYGLFEAEDLLGEEEPHMMYVTIFLSLGMFFTIVLPATCITSEKESRSWPLLLATTLGERQILFGKFVGVVRRCLPVWLFLFGHLILFTIARYIHPIAIVQVAILAAWVIVFLCCTGLYFSARFKRTTTAVIMNLALAAVIWGLIPLLLIILAEITRLDNDFAELYIDLTNPICHGLVVTEATANGWSHAGGYEWLELGAGDTNEAIFVMLLVMLGYMCAGLLFTWRAKRHIRRNIF
jgi:ABC-type transport system involved in multi-copper enzyme maturation permease subunit